MKKPTLHAMIFLLAVLPTVGLSQDDIGEQLKRMARVNAESYVSPLIAGWASGLNSGIYHSADLHDVLGFDVQIKLTGARLTDADKKYKFKTPASIGAFTRGTDYPAEIEANTIAGAKSTVEVRHSGTNALLMTIPGGLDLSTAPMIIPQLSVGLPFGIEVTGRFLPTTKLQSYGKVSYTGFGIRHDIDQYIPLLPVDIAVHFITQKFNYEDGSGTKVLSASGTAYGVEASKKLLFLTVYGGFQLESSSFDVGPFDATIQTSAGSVTEKVQFNVKGKNSSRALVGVRVLLLFLNVHADYSFATVPMVTLGAGISFR